MVDSSPCGGSTTERGSRRSRAILCFAASCTSWSSSLHWLCHLATLPRRVAVSCTIRPCLPQKCSASSIMRLSLRVRSSNSSAMAVVAVAGSNPKALHGQAESGAYAKLRSVARKLLCQSLRPVRKIKAGHCSIQMDILRSAHLPWDRWPRRSAYLRTRPKRES